MRLLVKRDDVWGALAFELLLTPVDTSKLVGFRPAGAEPWLKLDGRLPSQILGELSLWAMILEQKTDPPELVGSVIQEGL